jgi:ADP-ribose pyrophosphatase YjhB (NUDIX family)/predicted transcriptional regulator
MLAKIKKEILSRLLRSKEWLKYSELYDRKEENDLFNYHLQHLVDKEFVQKVDKKYHITDKGILFTLNDGSIGAQNYDVDKMKVNVLNLVVKYENNQILILNQKRKRYPFFGNSGISGGVVLKGEKILDAAKRNLKMKTGLDGEFSKIMGTIRGIFYLHDEIFQDIFYFICFCDRFTGKLIEENEISINKWTTLDQMIESEIKEHFGWSSLIRTFQELKIKNIDNINHFFEEEIVKVESLN